MAGNEPANIPPSDPADAASAGRAADAAVPKLCATLTKKRRWWQFPKPVTKRAKRIRLAVRLFVVLLMLLPVVIAVLTQGPIASAIIAGFVRRSTGAEFTADWVSLRLDGRLVITEPRLSVPGMTGEAARFAEAHRVEVDLDFGHVLSGNIQPDSVRIDQPRLRLSQSASGQLNISRLSAPPMTGAPGSSRFPRLDFSDAVLDLGEEDDTGAYHTLAEAIIKGWIAPTGVTSDDYLVHFVRSAVTAQSIDPSSLLQVTGQLNFRRGEGHISLGAIELSAVEAARFPIAYRSVWQALGIEGTLAKTDLRFTRQHGMETQFTLQNVSINLPAMDAGGRVDAAAPTASTPRMEKVSGTLLFASSGIEADFAGMLEDLPCHVEFRSQGVRMDSAYTCAIESRAFKLEKEPRLLQFAPQVARQILERFSGPTATVDARIEVRRGEPGPNGPAAADASGTLLFKDGTAAFEYFPYPVNHLSGRVTFDKDKVLITGIHGVGPTGASLLADGIVMPPTNDAQVDITINMADVPLDDVVEKAVIAAHGGSMMRSVFSHERYAELHAAGLIISSAERDAARSRLATLEAADRGSPDANEIADLRAKLARPVFDFGGMVEQVRILVSRAPGKDKPYTKDITVEFKNAGLLPEVFAYPLIADGMILHINDTSSELAGQRFRSVAGVGTAQVSAKVNIDRMDQATGQLEFAPDVKVSAVGVPIDELLINAIPEGRLRIGPPAADAHDAAAHAGEESRGSIKSVLREMGLAGAVDCEAHVFPKPGAGTQMGYDVTVGFADLSARPVHPVEAGQQGPPSMDVLAQHIAGTVHATDAKVEAPMIRGQLRSAEEGEPAAIGTFEISASSTLADEATRTPGTFAARVNARGLDLNLRAEDLVTAISPEAGGGLRTLRQTYEPTGLIDMDVGLTSSSRTGGSTAGAAGTDVSVSVSSARNLGLTVLGSRVGLDLDQGTMSVGLHSAGVGWGPVELRFDNAVASARYGGDEPVQLRLSGSAAIERDAGGDRLVVRDRLAGEMTDGRFESDLTRRLAGMAVSGGVKSFMDSLEPEGSFDASFLLAAKAKAADAADPPAPRDGRPPSPAASDPGGDWTYDFSLRPHDVILNRDALSLRIPRIGGEVRVTSAGGTIDHLSLATDLWTVRANGQWAWPPKAGGDLALTATVGCDAIGLDPALVALLPATVQERLDESRVTTSQPVHMSAGKLDLATNGDGVDRLTFDGKLAFSGLSADVGLDLTGCDGTLGVRAEKASTAEPVIVSLELAAPRMKLSGVAITDARAVAVAGRQDGEVILPTFVGDCYGGRLVGRAVVRAPGETRTASAKPGPAPAAPRRYEAKVEFAGVRFADMLAALESEADQAERPGPAKPDRVSAGMFRSQPPEAPANPNLAGDASRGWLDGELAISGVLGKPRTREGRGSIRVAGGDVVRMPLTTRLMELSNLQLPLSDSLDYFHAAFYIEGPMLVFDEFGLLSSSMSVLGTGTMHLPDMTLDLALRTQGRARLPLVSSLFETVRDEIFTARVRGTLSHPDFAAESLAGTRKLIGSLFGASSAAAPLEGAEDRLRAERDRSRSPDRRSSGTPEP